MKSVKQKYGHINPIFLQEEISLMSALDNARESTTNSQILGKNREKGIIDFLNKYLPNCFRTVSGHFVTPSGILSPEIDAMVIDSRYPLLSQNEDGSVIAMLHSVIVTIEVKSSLNKREIEKIRGNGKIISKLNMEAFSSGGKWGGLLQFAIAYRTNITLGTIGRHFFWRYRRNNPDTFLYLLRHRESEQLGPGEPIGGQFWMEGGMAPSYMATFAPLSDFYYHLTQTAYYTLSSRNFGFNDLGRQVMKYMAWGTTPRIKRGTSRSNRYLIAQLKIVK